MARTKRPPLRTTSSKNDKPKEFAIDPQFIEKFEQYLEANKKIQKNLLDFIDNDENDEENFENLKHIFHDLNIQNDEYELTQLLLLISTICENHNRSPHFFIKMERILQLFKADIKKYYSNSEIFKIFSNNKRILLFLIE